MHIICTNDWRDGNNVELMHLHEILESNFDGLNCSLTLKTGCSGGLGASSNNSFGLLIAGMNSRMFLLNAIQLKVIPSCGRRFLWPTVASLAIATERNDDFWRDVPSNDSSIHSTRALIPHSFTPVFSMHAHIDFFSLVHRKMYRNTNQLK